MQESWLGTERLRVFSEQIPSYLQLSDPGRILRGGGRNSSFYKGTVIRTTIDGIEVFKKKKPAAVDTPATLYFRTVEPEMIYINDIIQNIKRAVSE